MKGIEKMKSQKNTEHSWEEIESEIENDTGVKPDINFDMFRSVEIDGKIYRQFCFTFNPSKDECVVYPLIDSLGLITREAGIVPRETVEISVRELMAIMQRNVGFVNGGQELPEWIDEEPVSLSEEIRQITEYSLADRYRKPIEAILAVAANDPNLD